MTDYKKLVEALRCCDKYALCNDCPIFETCDGDVDKAMAIAAAAIEELQAQVQFYKALAYEWQSSAENKERLLGLYRAERAKHFYSAIDDNGRIKVNPCACTNIPVFPDSSESPNS